MHFYDTLTFMILRNATVPIFAIDFYYKYLYYNRTVDDRFTRAKISLAFRNYRFLRMV